MVNRVQGYLSVLLLLLGGFAGQVAAHQQKEAISTVLFNQRSGNIEVAHRFYIHDAEHAVKRLLKGHADLLKDKAVQKAFAEYVTKHFSLALNGHKPLPLRLLGQEIEGKFLWVYQESPNLGKPHSVDVTSDALMEIWPSQRNIVNIEGLGPVKSVALRNFERQQTVNFK